MFELEILQPAWCVGNMIPPIILVLLLGLQISCSGFLWSCMHSFMWSVPHLYLDSVKEVFFIGLGNLVSNDTNIMTLNAEAIVPCTTPHHFVKYASTWEQVFFCCTVDFHSIQWLVPESPLSVRQPLLILRWSNCTTLNYSPQHCLYVTCWLFLVQ
jgi:hypothetical protein